MPTSISQHILSAAFVFAALMSCCTSGSQADEASVQLTTAQQKALLSEATAAYEHGMEAAATNVADARQSFSDAAQKYQTLVDSGIRNGLLYNNLGNAYRHAGEAGRAIAAYENAAALLPGDSAVTARLNATRSMAGGGAKDASAELSITDRMAHWNQRVSRFWRFACGLAAWTTIWIAGVFLLWNHRSRWRYAIVPAVFVTTISVASLIWDWSNTSRTDRGVVVSESVMRTANGENFAPVFEKPLSAGTLFEIEERRDNWIQIRIADGQSGWVDSDSVEIIPATPFLFATAGPG